MHEITPFLMFSGDQHGRAREAVEFYVSLFPGASLVSMDFFEASDAEPAGTVRRAVFRLDGREFMAMDSVVPHPFDFTPSVSFLIQCESEDEIASLFGALVGGDQARSKRSAFITLLQAAAKSRANFSPASSWA